MTVRYQKTDAGREEIRARAHALPRPARNLLLIIDGTRNGDEWVAMVNGAELADLAALLQAGLVAPAAPLSSPPKAAPAASSSASASAPATAPPAAASMPQVQGARSLEQALQALDYRQLYDLLTAQARPRLGLIKSYRMVLEIERCAGVEEIRRLALRFVNDVRDAQGEAAARTVMRDMGAQA